MWKNIVEPDRPWGYRHTLRIYTVFTRVIHALF